MAYGTVSCTPVDLPQPSEADISWLLTEAKRYMNAEISLERKHVLSAWCGIRPLAKDPSSVSSSSEVGSTAAVSRDHVISHNRETGTVFAAGGKWTTYREMWGLLCILMFMMYSFGFDLERKMPLIR